ncbi:MAG TPA: hypothetical protein VIM41_11320 [Gammaproteobacteria bacterium]
MRDLQSFDFDKSQYERVNQKWICGNQSTGQDCAKGPDARGQCRAGAECKPYKNGDRWECARSILQGGKCEHGPQGDGGCYHRIPPCKPIRSLRARRGLMVAGVGFVCLALAALFSAAPLRDLVINPGSLSAKHSAKVQQCDSCHDKKTANPVHWLGLAFADTNQTKPSACVNCHKIGATAMNPHNLDGEQLKTIKTRLQVSLKDNAVQRFNLFSDAPDSNASGKVQCDTCHKEHRGKHTDLKRVENFRCMDCHVSRHVDFKDEHPEFVDFAYSRRTHLRFDHGKHFEKYFKEEKVAEHAPESCASCHSPDNESGVMVSRSFKDGCMRCHKNDTTAESFTEKGVVFFRLPSLDLDTLSANNISIGQWPDGLEDEELTPMMLFLLSSNEELRPLLEQLAARELNLAELDGVPPETLQLVGKLINHLKDLLLIMANQSSQWLSLVETLANQRLDEVSRAAVENFLPAQQMNRAFAIWIPNLSIEKLLRNRGKQADNKLVPVDHELLQTDANTVRPGRWYVQGYALLYRPKGHEDEMLRTWLEVSRAAIMNKNTVAMELLNNLAHEDTPGQCMRCHSVDNVDGVVSLNWKARNLPPEKRLFTVFSHAPHMKVLKADQCNTCHNLNSKADYAGGYKDMNPFVYQSNFLAIQKQTCAQCHSASKVGDTCVTCHKYHLTKTLINGDLKKVAAR